MAADIFVTALPARAALFGLASTTVVSPVIGKRPGLRIPGFHSYFMGFPRQFSMISLRNFAEKMKNRAPDSMKNGAGQGGNRLSPCAFG
ncbi:hypothetical protein [Mesorhizobium sp. RMAD-H1]|uniref:hypothetical protein n=1 Tax=Mesorhizobium sp. RMAD-H1 TaxID=2587065 RepID=UPI00160B5E38|nr:hypothetical protein [Mesorhizobium sp. RMAD-H1]MBB2971669.1 hypothetical protein [Mesorhizobium sp. RMAD-H1]